MNRTFSKEEPAKRRRILMQTSETEKLLESLREKSPRMADRIVRLMNKKKETLKTSPVVDLDLNSSPESEPADSDPANLDCIIVFSPKAVVERTISPSRPQAVSEVVSPKNQEITEAVSKAGSIKTEEITEAVSKHHQSGRALNLGTCLNTVRSGIKLIQYRYTKLDYMRDFPKLQEYYNELRKEELLSFLENGRSVSLGVAEDFLGTLKKVMKVEALGKWFFEACRRMKRALTQGILWEVRSRKIRLLLENICRVSQWKNLFTYLKI